MRELRATKTGQKGKKNLNSFGCNRKYRKINVFLWDIASVSLCLLRIYDAVISSSSTLAKAIKLQNTVQLKAFLWDLTWKHDGDLETH